MEKGQNILLQNIFRHRGEAGEGENSVFRHPNTSVKCLLPLLPTHLRRQEQRRCFHFAFLGTIGSEVEGKEALYMGIGVPENIYCFALLQEHLCLGTTHVAMHFDTNHVEKYYSLCRCGLIPDNNSRTDPKTEVQIFFSDYLKKIILAE